MILLMNLQASASASFYHLILFFCCAFYITLFHLIIVVAGQTTDERGNAKPVAIMQYRVNGQYIMEGLAASFMFSLGGNFHTIY